MVKTWEWRGAILLQCVHFTHFMHVIQKAHRNSSGRTLNGLQRFFPANVVMKGGISSVPCGNELSSAIEYVASSSLSYRR
jgi:hypothetical protein